MVRNLKNVIISKSFQGQVNDDIDFTYGEGTAAFYGCGASLRGEFWYFGGYHGAINTLRQVSQRIFSNI